MPYLLIALLLALSPPLLGQDKPAAPTAAPPAQSSAPPAATAAPAPAAEVYPLSRLRFTQKEAEINLSWEEASGFAGQVAVYRGTEPFSAASFAKARKLAEVGAGLRKFADKPEATGAYYYAILPVGESWPSKGFQAGRNAIGVAIPVTVAAAPVAPPAPARKPRIAAAVDKDSVIVEYVGPASQGQLLLYRGTSALSDAASLLSAAVVAAVDPSGGRFVDYPVPGIDYWYGLVAEEELKAGKLLLVKGVSATAQPVRIPAELIGIGMAGELPYSRTPPLPSFYLDRGISSSSPLFAIPGAGPPARELAPETAKALAALLAPYPATRPKAPRLVLLPPERAKPSGGEDYALNLIVQEKLVKGADAEAADQLRRYLSLNRGADAQARARFYLGVALARLGEKRDAVFEFLAAREAYPQPTSPWLDYLMAELRLGG